MSFRILGDVLRGEGRRRLKLPDVRGVRPAESREAHLRGVRDGRRPRHRMEPRRGDRRVELPDAAQNTQPLERQPLEPMRTSRSLSSAAPPA